jgi:hypothetical protein
MSDALLRRSDFLLQKNCGSDIQKGLLVQTSCKHQDEIRQYGMDMGPNTGEWIQSLGTMRHTPIQGYPGSIPVSATMFS